MKPGYKQTEVGVIPVEWRAESLKGKVAISHGFPFSSEHFSSHGPYRLTTPGHFYEEGGFRDIGEKQKHYNGLVPSGYVLHPGELIVAMTEQADGLLGSAAVIPKVDGYLHNQRLGRVKTLSSEVELGFLFYVFNSPSYRAKVRETAAGTKVKHTSPKKLLEIPVRLPPPPEQRAIAGALSDVDTLIGALDQLISKKRDLKQAAMQQLLTGQKRLPGLHGEWELTSLDQIVVRTTGFWGAQDCDDNHPRRAEIIRAGDISPEGKLTATATRFLSEAEFSKAKCQLDDLVITTSGNGLGKVWWCDGRTNVAASNFVRVLRPIKSKAQGRFLSYVLRSGEASRQLLEHTATSAYPNLRPSFFSACWILLPPVPEQTAIAEVLADMDTELAALEQRRDKTRALKQGMMQELLTGRTRLI